MVLIPLSHPSRGAWIEIEKGYIPIYGLENVAPLAGCVD